MDELRQARRVVGSMTVMSDRQRTRAFAEALGLLTIAEEKLSPPTVDAERAEAAEPRYVVLHRTDAGYLSVSDPGYAVVGEVDETAVVDYALARAQRTNRTHWVAEVTARTYATAGVEFVKNDHKL